MTTTGDILPSPVRGTAARTESADAASSSRRAFRLSSIKGIWNRPTASEWVAFALLLWMLAMVGWSVQLANWGDLPNIIPTAIMGATAAFVMSRLSIHWIAKSAAFLIAGAAIVAWQGSLPAEGANVIERSFDAWARMDLWIDIAINGGVSGDTVPFALIFMATTWTVSYAVSALTFRTLSPWVPVMALGLGLLTNLSHRHGQFEYTFYLFVVGATAQFAHLIALNRVSRWRELSMIPPRSAMWQSARDGLALGAAIVLVAVLLPFYEVTSQSVERRWNAVFLDPFLAMRSTAERLLAGIPSGKDAVLDAPNPVLPFQGAIELTEEELFRVRSRFAKMHPGRIYHEYTSNGWVAAPSVKVAASANARIQSQMSQRGLIDRELAELAVQPSSTSNLVVPAAGVHSVNLPSVVDILEPQVWDFPLTGPLSSLDRLPADLREFGYAIRNELLLIANKIESTDGTRYTIETQPPMDTVSVDQAIGLLYASDTNIPWEQFTFNMFDNQERSGVGYMRLVRNAPIEHNAVVLAYDTSPGQQYLVTTSVSTAEAEDLSWANDEYPAYITDRYLQLPDSLPQPVSDLAHQIVDDAQAESPWEISQAVKRFLQSQEYSLEIDGPDPFTDGIQYFLFETVNEPCPSDNPRCDRSKIKGYSQYFGSAGTVLLRANGVPARFIAGWSAGEYLPSEGQFLIRDRNRHGWTQVYLPPFGWIDLEVTPGRPAVPRNLRVPTTPLDQLPPPVVGSAEYDPDFMAALEYLESLVLDEDLPFESPRFATDGTNAGGFDPPWTLMGAGAATLVLLFSGWFAWRWNLRGQNDAVRAYTQWTRVAMLMGYRRPLHLSAREYGTRLGTASEHSPRLAEVILDRYERHVYGNCALSDSEDAGDDSDEVSDNSELSSAWRGAATALVKHRIRQIFRRAQSLQLDD